MADWKFHCDVLCVPENASPAEIKAAFRKLALRHHPDHGGTKDKFQRLNSSYKYLLRNMASRPAPRVAQPPPRRPSRAAPESPKKEPAPHMAALRLGTRVFQQLLRSARPQLSRGEQLLRRNRATIFAALPAVTAGLAAVISLTVFFTHGSPGELGRETLAEQAASAAKDEFGRVRGSCENFAFEHGNLRDKSKSASSEWACQIDCNHWFSTHESTDASCAWNGKTLETHAANQNSQPARSPASTPPPAQEPIPPSMKPHLVTEGPGKGFYEVPMADVEFIMGQDFENVSGGVPFLRKTITLNQELQLETPVAPVLWINQRHAFIGQQGKDNHHVTLSAMVPGEVSVVITDHLKQPIETILVTILPDGKKQ